MKPSLDRERYAVDALELPPRVLRGRSAAISLDGIPANGRKRIRQ